MKCRIKHELMKCRIKHDIMKCRIKHDIMKNVELKNDCIKF